MDKLAANWDNLQHQFYVCFIAEDRWRWLWNGFGATMKITLIALVMGLAIGCIIAMIRVSYDRTYATTRSRLARFFLKFFNFICHVYLTIIRGTPVVVQLMIWYFVILLSLDGIKVACIAFGVNSGAYVAEIVRAGIMSVDNGQMEAGRSLGLSYWRTMAHIVLPQAFKNVLPALCNEAIVLVKETSVAGYVAILDLTKGGDIIRSRTYIAFMPLLAVALVYLLTVMLLTWLLGRLERRLRAGDSR